MRAFLLDMTVFFRLEQRVAVEETCNGHEVKQTIFVFVPIAYPKCSDSVVLATTLSDPCVELTDDELVEGLIMSDDFFQLSETHHAPNHRLLCVVSSS
ncbi:unnamed protein product [Nippostrongylus brasiliensis]|uniref:RWD domain-containing protein n=1 Tax=Nippostrongylus brasiliensis TaxID=27835 RepID=A0A0N4Y111_NIPBR|nr:unnamed protein product [Nippostrongylus brasiliensis]